MRFKQGKGDPAGFKEFMHQENIRPGMIVRYVGNRFHVMFHLAAVFFHLKEKLLKYLDNTCRCSTGFRSALQKDLKNEQILLQLQALGLMGKLVTGPWMQQLYNEHLKNLDSILHIRTCLQNLKKLKDTPLLALETRSDMFDMPLDPFDTVLQSVQNSGCSEPEKECLKDILLRLITCIVEVIERQLNEYLEGRLSNLSPELSAQCSSAPVHNMFAERTLALSDFHLRRASNVQIGFVDGIVKSKINGTMHGMAFF